MRNFIKQAIFIFCCIILCGIPSNATSADMTENTKVNVTTPFATISDAYISHKTVTKGETLTYRFTISFVDTFDYESEEFAQGSFKSDAYKVDMYWKSSDKQEIQRTYKWLGSEVSVTIEDTIPIRKGTQAGEWKIEHIYISNYSEDDALSIHHGTQEDQKNKGSFGYHFADLSFSSFNVTGVKKKADNKAPTIVKKSLTVSKTKVKKNKKSTFFVQVKDESGIESVTCIWDLVGKDDYYDYYKKMKYNKKTKKYECTIKLTRYDKKARLRCITTKDIYGNTEYYSLSNPTFKKKYKKAFSKVTVYRK